MPATTDFVVNKEKLQVSITRDFNAPRERVWKVINDPSRVPQWWGPQRYKTKVDKMGVRVGGAWRYVHSNEDGDYGFSGIYREIVAPQKVVQTFEFEPMAGHISTQTMTLEELPGGQIRMHVLVEFENLSDLEGMVGSGMQEGNTESYDRLAKLVE